jgi:hypothetical protein
MRIADGLATTLLVIGGLNWGLVGAFGFDLVAALLGEMSPVARAVYVLVGLAALYRATTLVAGRGEAGAPARARV